MNRMKQKLVSIVIPTFNRYRSLNRLIDSIKESTYSNYEIIIVDDASTDALYHKLNGKFKNNHRIRIFHNPKNMYTAFSRNYGILHSKGEYIFFIDDDNVIEKNAIGELVKSFESNNRIGELGLVNYSYSNRNKILWVCTRRNMLTSKTNQPRSLDEFGGLSLWDTADVPNAFMVRADIIKGNKIFFDAMYEIMYEESDFAYRIREAGYDIKVLRKAKIYHDIENSLQGDQKLDYMYHFMKTPRRLYVFARNRILFHSKYSNRLGFLFITILCIWLFTAYYSYKILSYFGVGNFSFIRKIQLIMQYCKGNVEGLRIVFLHGKQ
jgi:GT2 family glycosyltransferase